MNLVEAVCILHVPPDAGDAEIRAAYRMEASAWHPDRGGDTEAMQEINSARAYMLGMSAAERRAEWRRLKPRINMIMDATAAKIDAWEARRDARRASRAAESPAEKEKTKSQVRRAAAWEAKNAARVREQTRARVAKRRAADPEAYKAYMREYMRKRRAAG